MNKKRKVLAEKKKRICFLALGLKNILTTLMESLAFELAIIDINREIMDVKNKIEYHENLIETALESKRVELNIAFLKNKLKSLQLTLVGLRSYYGSNLQQQLQVNELVLERIKECIIERQEIIEEISENGWANDNQYNQHCLHHRDIIRVLDR